jgi:hypothetical protein
LKLSKFTQTFDRDFVVFLVVKGVEIEKKYAFYSAFLWSLRGSGYVFGFLGF